jgi:hypothetical protein
MASMPDIGQDADLPIRTPTHRLDARHGPTDQKLVRPPLTSNRVVTLLTCQVAIAIGSGSAAAKCSNQADLRLTPADRVRRSDLPQRPSLTALHLVCI